jgi:hypothetical protein
MTRTTTCGICGDEILSRVPETWHPSKLARRVQLDMQAHLKTHSFAEVLRFQIRQDLDEVPDEQRPGIVRDIYRNLLGTQSSEGYALGDLDSRGVYTIDDALGAIEVYRLWRSASRCGLAGCAH